MIQHFCWSEQSWSCGNNPNRHRQHQSPVHSGCKSGADFVLLFGRFVECRPDVSVLPRVVHQHFHFHHGGNWEKRQVFQGSFPRALLKIWRFPEDIGERVVTINEFFTFNLFSNVCRSLFEKHKLHFAFLMCIRILMEDGQINPVEWQHFLAGGSPLRVKKQQMFGKFQAKISKTPGFGKSSPQLGLFQSVERNFGSGGFAKFQEICRLFFQELALLQGDFRQRWTSQVQKSFNYDFLNQKSLFYYRWNHFFIMTTTIIMWARVKFMHFLPLSNECWIRAKLRNLKFTNLPYLEI